jgi:hypothetical protein
MILIRLLFMMVALLAIGKLWSQETPDPTPVHRPTAAIRTPTTSAFSGNKEKKPRNRKKIQRNRTLNTPTPSPVPSPIVLSVPTPTPTPDLLDTPTSGVKPTPTPDGKLAQVSILSDPVRGNKAIFRVVVHGKGRALIRIYDKTYTKVTQLEGEGDGLFDILWTLKKVPEGIYHFQSQVILGTGEVVTPDLQNFTIEKDIETPSVP